jgi:hypothetical protein
MLSLLPVLLACAITEPPSTGAASPAPAIAYSVLEAPDRRVRAPDPRMRNLLVEGFYRSPTFAALLTALNDSNVIVYIETTMTLPKETRGRITIVPLSGKKEERYLRIQIKHDLSKREAIALIGHEMRHALEIADATEVRDIGGLIKLYERIGHSSGGEHTYDTVAAQDTGRKILGELLRS